MNLMNYIHCLNSLKYHIKVNKERGQEMGYIASSFAVSTNIPIIAVYYFIAHLEGTNSFIEEQINSLKIFYKIDTISGIEEVKNEINEKERCNETSE